MTAMAIKCKADRLATEKPGHPEPAFCFLIQELFTGDSAMKKIPLTQGKFALVDDEDYDWLMTWKWRAVKDGNNYYAATIQHGSGKGYIAMHRLLLMYPKKGLHTDHINHNGLDNRKTNLRECTPRENQSNRRKKCSSKYLGVYWHKVGQGWQSELTIGSKRTYLGFFKKEIDAHIAYSNALEKAQKEGKS